MKTKCNIYLITNNSLKDLDVFQGIKLMYVSINSINKIDDNKIYFQIKINISFLQVNTKILNNHF